MRYYKGMSGSVLVVLIWGLIALKRGYTYLPAFEMKRRGSRGNQILRDMALIAPYQTAVRLLINALLVLIAFVYLLTIVRTYSNLEVGFIFAGTALGVWYFSKKNIAMVVRLCAWLGKYLLPIVANLQKVITRLTRSQTVITEIYEREDLKRLITRQATAVNNRISSVDLEAVMHVLEFEHRKIATVMVPYKQIRFVNAKEPIGPILLSELHKSGYKQFPVLGNAKHDIQGILSLKEVADYAEGGYVTEAMDPEVMYVRDNQPLEQVLQAFTKTGKQIFIVIDTREKVLGLITVRDVLEEIIGHTIHGDFNDYHNRELVARN